eukprot:6186112-Pleurochrysis_carterae.AAC.10
MRGPWIPTCEECQGWHSDPDSAMENGKASKEMAGKNAPKGCLHGNVVTYYRKLPDLLEMMER